MMDTLDELLIDQAPQMRMPTLLEKWEFCITKFYKDVAVLFQQSMRCKSFILTNCTEWKCNFPNYNH